MCAVVTTKSRKHGKQSAENGLVQPKSLLSPFVQIQNQWYVIINWQPGMEPEANLELRPLNECESGWLEPELEDAVFEVWARLFKDDEAMRNGAEPLDQD